MRLRLLIVFFVVYTVFLASAQKNCESQFCERLYKTLPHYQQEMNRERSDRVLLYSRDFKVVEAEDTSIFLIPALYFKKTFCKKIKESENFLCLIDPKSFVFRTTVLLTDSGAYNIMPQNKVRFPETPDVNYRIHGEVPFFITTSYYQTGKVWHIIWRQRRISCVVGHPEVNTTGFLFFVVR